METCEKQISDTVLDVEHKNLLIISYSKYSRNGNILLFESDHSHLVILWP